MLNKRPTNRQLLIIIALLAQMAFTAILHSEHITDRTTPAGFSHLISLGVMTLTIFWTKPE
ncbi:hypothetical protein [Mucisphaera calidilacus]|uniref:Uncharacterized protein n=1 Tax=Mucisphaera calidilacus TaxID=2527982 RepID=A0A518C084_9BACT|nr:hypothetical protein [Mucisphaera calidilacus]QDU72634.1 hypothetical protein Pan265_25060 [Mucisphaera calidilacus]